MKLLALLVTWIAGLFNREAVEPSLYEGECTNAHWIYWWCDKFNAPFYTGQVAWLIVTAHIEEPPFEMEKDWNLWFLKDHPDLGVELMSSERGRRVLLRALTKTNPEPQMIEKNGWLSGGWVVWYTARHCCGHDAASKVGYTLCARQGVIPGGITNPPPDMDSIFANLRV